MLLLELSRGAVLFRDVLANCFYVLDRERFKHRRAVEAGAHTRPVCRATQIDWVRFGIGGASDWPGYGNEDTRLATCLLLDESNRPARAAVAFGCLEAHLRFGQRQARPDERITLCLTLSGPRFIFLRIRECSCQNVVGACPWLRSG